MLSRGAKPVKERARRARGRGGSESGRRERLSFAAGLASRLDVFWRPGVDHLSTTLWLGLGRINSETTLVSRTIISEESA